MNYKEEVVWVCFSFLSSIING